MYDFISNRIIEPSLILYEAELRRKNITENIPELLEKKKSEIFLKQKEEKRGGGMCGDNYFYEMPLNSNKLVLPRVALIVSTKCSLKCKDCINLMPYYDEPYDLNIEELITEMEGFLNLVDELMELSIGGGEPFLYNNLDKLLEYLLSNEKIRAIRITTNGTVIPKENVLKLMADKRIWVQISDYGNVHAMVNLVMVLDEYGIYTEVASDLKWVDCGGVIKKNRTKKEIEDIYLSCDVGKMCKVILKGKLFECGRGAFLNDLGFSEDIEFLEIKKASKKDVLEFWLKGTAEECDYCDRASKHPKVIESAIQVNGTHVKRSNYTLIARKNYNDIVEAKEYWEKEFHKQEETVKELQEWTRELENAKKYFLQQIENLQKENAVLRENGK